MEDHQLYITIQFTEYKGILFLSFSLKQSIQYQILTKILAKLDELKVDTCELN